MVRVRILRASAAEEGGGPIRLETDEDWIQLSCPEARPDDSPQSVDLTPGQPDPGTLWKPAVADNETVTLRSPVLIELQADRWRVVDGWGSRAEIDVARPLEFSPVGSPESGVWLRSRRFPGVLRILAQGDADERTIEVINHVAMESYLPGVLAGEIYSHWRVQTHAAQAVAARSFACCEQAYFASRRHYDITNTSRSQMYEGSEASDRAVEAVEMTRGQVLAWEERLVPGYYSSCCGGTAARAVDAIGPNPVNDIPPLHGRSGSDICSAAPRYRWEVNRPVRMLTQRLVAWGEERGIEDLAALTRIISIEVAEQNEHGRPISYVITDRRDHRVEIPAKTLRIAANFGNEDLDRPDKPLHSSHIEVTIIGRTVSFEGRGHGHGAGLCQYGAQALAVQGGEYESILRWYYPEVEIAQAYS